MSKGIIGFLILALSGLSYPFFVKPLQDETSALKAEIRTLEETIQKIDEFLIIRDDLVRRSKSFTAEERDKLAKILPENVDEVNRIVDLEALVRKHGLELAGDIMVSTDKEDGGTLSIGESVRPVTFEMNLSGSYDEFLAFLDDMSKSLVLFDIEKLGIAISDEDKKTFSFDVTVRTNELAKPAQEFVLE